VGTTRISSTVVPSFPQVSQLLACEVGFQRRPPRSFAATGERQANKPAAFLAGPEASPALPPHQ
jgi:hypothetical protein